MNQAELSSCDDSRHDDDKCNGVCRNDVDIEAVTTVEKKDNIIVLQEE